MTLDKFNDKYRIPSTRAAWWDYGWNGSYYVTICTRKRRCWFGDVINKQMQLSEIGVIAEQCWSAIPDHFPFVHLGEYVVMPNHVHGIINIVKPIHEQQTSVEDPKRDSNPGIPLVETQYFASLRGERTFRVYEAYQSESQPRPKNKFGPQSQNLGSIIRGFKTGVKKGSKSLQPEFSWQGRFHDHIIRTEEEYRRISRYIRDNPANWEGDRFYEG